MIDSVEYTLKNKITTAKDGGVVDVFVVELCAPAKKVMRHTYNLQQHITRALVMSSKLFGAKGSGEAKNPNKDDEDNSIKANEVLTAIIASDVDFDACLTEFEKLAFKGCVKVNDMPINKIQWDKLDFEDEEGLFAEFVANFIGSYVMAKL